MRLQSYDLYIACCQLTLDNEWMQGQEVGAWALGATPEEALAP